MITDRRRFGTEWQAHLLAHVTAAARAGVHLVQVRERDMEARPLVELVSRCVAAVRHTRTRILVNDRVDVALAAGAHGVHLRGDSMAAPRVRAMTAPEFLIGRSVRSRDEALRAQEDGELHYLVFGTVFETRSKPGMRGAGLDALAEVAAAVRVPVLAIGGVTAATLPAVHGAGAAGFAAIGWFADHPADQMQVAVQQASAAFDTPSGVP
jgi:thiamine-phosphate pyrophosphorylase